MSATEKVYSERELRLAEREAFRAGAAFQESRHRYSCQPFGDTVIGVARNAYPLPPITRPRVVRLDNEEVRYIDGGFEVRDSPDGRWHSSMADPDRIRVLADLLANPTETVPDDADAAPVSSPSSGGSPK